MKKIFVIILIVNLSFTTLAMNSKKWSLVANTCACANAIEDGPKIKEILERNKEELLKIIRPGFESLMTEFVANTNVLEGHKKPINSVAISRCGLYIFTGDDKQLIIWNKNNHSIIASLDVNGGVQSVAISKNGKFLAIGCFGTCALFLDITDLKNIKKVELYAESSTRLSVRSIAISECDKYIVGGCFDGTTILWDISALSDIKIKELIQPNGTSRSVVANSVESVAISRCGKYIVSGCKNGKVILWDISNFENITQKELFTYAHGVKAVALSSCGRFIVAGSQDSTTIFNISDLNNITSQNFTDSGDVITSIAISKCGRYVITGSLNNALILRDISDINNIKKITIQEKNSMGVLNGVNAVAISQLVSMTAEGRAQQFMVIGSKNKTARIIDLSGWVINTLNLTQLKKLEELINLKNPQEIITCYFGIKKIISNNNFQKYIERYVRNKLMDYYLSGCNVGADLQNIINEYLEILGPKLTSIKKPTETHKLCAQCNKNNSNMQCSRCKKAFYCSQNCQKAHWSNHKLVCVKNK